MLNRISKWVGILLLVGITFECVRALPLLMPYPFFNYKTSFAEFALYADAPIDATTVSQLEEAIHRIRQSRLYNKSQQHRIFICQNESKYAFFTFIAGKNKYSQGINIEPTGNIFVSKSFIDSIRSRYGLAYTGTLLEGSMTHVVAHEVIHSVITGEIGYWASRKLPDWIKEGYAEYGASGSQQASASHEQLKRQTKRFLSLDTRLISPVRVHYLRSKLLVQYLIEIEGHPINTILTGNFEEESVYANLTQWYQEQSAEITEPLSTDESH